MLLSKIQRWELILVLPLLAISASYADEKKNRAEFVDLKDDPNFFVFDAYEGPSHTEENGAQAKAATAPPFAIDLIFKPKLHYTDKKSGYLDPANYLVYEASQEGEGKNAKYVIKDKDSPIAIGYVGALLNSASKNLSQPGQGPATQISPDIHSGVRLQGAQLDPHKNYLVTYVGPSSEIKDVLVKKNEKIKKTSFEWGEGNFYLRDKYLGNLVLEVSPNIGSSFESSGVKYDFSYEPAIGNFYLTERNQKNQHRVIGLFQSGLKSNGDFSFGPADKNESSTRRFEVDGYVSYLDFYDIDMPIGKTKTRVYPFFYELSPVTIEADQELDMINYSPGIKGYVAVPLTDTLVYSAFKTVTQPMVVYAGYAAQFALDRPSGMSSQFENRIDMGAVYRIPFLQKPATDKRPRQNQLFLDLTWEGHYEIDDQRFLSFFQSQLNYALTDDILVFGNYRIGKKPAQMDYVDGFQVGVTIGVGTEKSKTHTLVNTSGN